MGKGVEAGVVTAHPIKQMYLQVKTIWGTWMHCRKKSLPCNKWYGVYLCESEVLVAQTGCTPDSEERADIIAAALNQ